MAERTAIENQNTPTKTVRQCPTDQTEVSVKVYLASVSRIVGGMTKGEAAWHRKRGF